MDPEWAPVRDDPAAEQVWRKVLRPIAAELGAGAAVLAERILGRLEAERPQPSADAQAIGEVPAAIEASLRQLAQNIDVGANPRGLDLPAAVASLGRARVQQRVPLAYIMRTYRLAQDTLWDWLFGRITASASDAAEQAAALRLATGWLFAYIDSSAVRAEQVYEEEREAWLRSAAATRTAAIDDILADRERDPQRAAKRLRYDVNREHVAVSVWFESAPEDGDPQQVLTTVCTALAVAVSAESTLIQPVGSLALVGWLSWRRRLGAAEWDEAEVGRRLSLPTGVRVAMGEPGWGLKGFRRSHLEAAHARRVAVLAGPRGEPLTRYRSVALAALASVDRDQAASFVTRVLGPLAADDEATYRVAMTLAVYLQENRSPARAAQRLTVHPNTVSYRVNQAEAILGRSVDSDALEVSVALALLPLLAGMTTEL